MEKLLLAVDYFLPPELKTHAKPAVHLRPQSDSLIFYTWKLRLIVFALFVLCFFAASAQVTGLGKNYNTLYDGSPPAVYLGIALALLFIIRQYGHNQTFFCYLIIALNVCIFFSMSLTEHFMITACRAPIFVGTGIVQLGKKAFLPMVVSTLGILYYMYICSSGEPVNTIDFQRELLFTSSVNCVWIACACLFNEVLLEGSAKSVHKINMQLEKALRAKTEFLARCSHELRTPLNGLVGSIEVLLETAPWTSDQLYFLHICQDSSTVLTKLINDLLDLSKLELEQLDLHLAPRSLNKLIMSVINPLQVVACKKGIDLVQSTDCDVPDTFVTDDTRVVQVLNNLIGNSMKFTEEGSISLSVHYVPSFIEFVIKDTGVGIPPDKQEIIFEAFKQADDNVARHYGGFGLGLNISKLIADKMGGSISVYSDGTNGSTFTFRVPYIEPTEPIAVATEEPPRELTALPQTDVKLLLVDDNPVNTKVLEKLLNRLNINPDIASDGRDGLIKAQEGNYDFILMDIEMPVMNGITACKKLREISKYRDVPIVAFTAHVLSTEEQKQLQSDPGFTDFLIKPVTLPALKKTLNLQ